MHIDKISQRNHVSSSTAKGIHHDTFTGPNTTATMFAIGLMAACEAACTRNGSPAPKWRVRGSGYGESGHRNSGGREVRDGDMGPSLRGGPLRDLNARCCQYSNFS